MRLAARCGVGDCCRAAARGASWSQSTPTGEGQLDARTVAQPAAKKDYSPYVRRAPDPSVLRRHASPYCQFARCRAFGDTLGPEEAYRFARGEEVVSSTGQPAKLSRPLDFLVVADHAEALGSTVELKKGNPLLMADPALKRWHDMMNSDKGGEAAIELIRSVGTGTTPKALFNPKLARSVWQNYTATAERYNEPGRFTALIGYEWTSNNRGNNLHRVVVFRDDKDQGRSNRAVLCGRQ